MRQYFCLTAVTRGGRVWLSPRPRSLNHSSWGANGMWSPPIQVANGSTSAGSRPRPKPRIGSPESRKLGSKNEATRMTNRLAVMSALGLGPLHLSQPTLAGHFDTSRLCQCTKSLCDSGEVRRGERSWVVRVVACLEDQVVVDLSSNIELVPVDSGLRPVGVEIGASWQRYLLDSMFPLCSHPRYG